MAPASRTSGALTGRRTMILEAAARAFADRGIAGVRLHEIARAAGLNQATLLYYFPSKHAIYRACLEQAVEQLSEAFAEGYLAGDDSGAAVRVVGSLLDLFERRPELGRLIRQASLSGGREFEEVFLKPLRPWYRRGVRALRRAMKEGVISTEDAEELVLMLYGAILIYLTEDPLVAGLSGRDPQSPANRRRHRDFVMHMAGRLLSPPDGDRTSTKGKPRRRATSS